MLRHGVRDLSIAAKVDRSLLKAGDNCVGSLITLGNVDNFGVGFGLITLNETFLRLLGLGNCDGLLVSMGVARDPFARKCDLGFIKFDARILLDGLDVSLGNTHLIRVSPDTRIVAGYLPSGELILS